MGRARGEQVVGQRVHARQRREGGVRPQAAHHAAHVLAQPPDEAELVEVGAHHDQGREPGQGVPGAALGLHLLPGQRPGNEKLKLARRDYEAMMRTLMNADGNDVDDTSPTYKVLEEGSATQSKEELIQLANRQQKFITGLEAALVRIANKTSL